MSCHSQNKRDDKTGALVSASASVRPGLGINGLDITVGPLWWAWACTTGVFPQLHIITPICQYNIHHHYHYQYFILNGIVNFNSSALLSSKGCISHSTP